MIDSLIVTDGQDVLQALAAWRQGASAVGVSVAGEAPACHQSRSCSFRSRRYSTARAAVSDCNPDCPQNFHSSRAKRL